MEPQTEDSPTPPKSSGHARGVSWQRARNFGASNIPRIAVVLILVGLVLTLLNFGPSSARPQSNPGPSIGSDATTAPTAFATASDTAILASTATAGSNSLPGTPTSQGPTQPPNSTPTPAPLTVTAVTVAANPSDSFTGVCEQNVLMTFTATITVTPNPNGGTLKYDWYDTPDETSQFIHSDKITIGTGEQTKQFTFQEKLGASYGTGQTLRDTLEITAPSDIEPEHANFAFTCIRHVIGASMSASLATWSAPCDVTQSVVFTYTFTLSPGPQVVVTYTFEESSGWGEWIPPGPRTVTVPATNAQNSHMIVTGTLNRSLIRDNGGLTPNGSYWMKVDVSAPNSVSSDKAITVKDC